MSEMKNKLGHITLQNNKKHHCQQNNENKTIHQHTLSAASMLAPFSNNNAHTLTLPCRALMHNGVTPYCTTKTEDLKSMGMQTNEMKNNKLGHIIHQNNNNNIVNKKYKIKLFTNTHYLQLQCLLLSPTTMHTLQHDLVVH